MGLTDILTGMMNGPRGQRQPSSGGGGGGMSPIMMALLGLLAYKALKGRGGQAAYPGGTGQRMPPGGTASAGTPGGGLDDILGGLFDPWRIVWRQARQHAEWQRGKARRQPE